MSAESIVLNGISLNVIGKTLKSCEFEYAELNKFISKGIIDKLNNVVNEKFERISYDKAIELVEEGLNYIDAIVLFCEINNVSSLKIHTKLHYYEGYKLERTDYKINGINLLKYSDGENYLHSHNATIWNRQYLLEHLIDGEDPWTNEIQGSKRMSSVPHNHYHYNIHWYSQPGVSEMGNYSSDFHILAPIFDDRMEYKLKYNF